MSRMRILLVSRSASVAAELKEMLSSHPMCKVSTKIVSNGHVDPLHDVSMKPDALLLHCESSLGELQYLADAASADQPPLIVIGPATDPT